jgi:hypothetical protein
MSPADAHGGPPNSLQAATGMRAGVLLLKRALQSRASDAATTEDCNGEYGAARQSSSCEALAHRCRFEAVARV